MDTRTSGAVVVGVGGSPHARHALARAAHIARHGAAPVDAP